MNNKLLSFLGIARKSGNLFLGMDNVKNNMVKKNIILILTTKDISKLSLKKINQVSMENKARAVSIDCTMQDINLTLGKYSGIIGISNENIVNKILSLVEPRE